MKADVAKFTKNMIGSRRVLRRQFAVVLSVTELKVRSLDFPYDAGGETRCPREHKDVPRVPRVPPTFAYALSARGGFG